MTQLPPAPNTDLTQGSTRLVVVALVVAAAALVLVNIYIGQVRSQAREGEFIVYRLRQSVKPGDRLRSRDDVEAVPVPERFRDSFSDAVDEAGLTARIGETFRRHAGRYDVLSYDLFVDPDENELDRHIGREMRLVALPVNPRTLPGDLRPGMYVDIEAPFPSHGAVPNVLPVMERVRVMLVGEYSIVDEASADTRRPRLGNYSTISIEVSPEQATQLSRIGKIVAGDFELHLRNPADTSQPKIPTGGINPEVLKLLDSGRR